MTILAPLLMAAVIVVPIWLTTLEDDDVKNIAVYDNPVNNFEDILTDSKSLKFTYINKPIFEKTLKNFESSGYYAMLYNPAPGEHPHDSIILCSHKQPSLNVKMEIAGAIEHAIENKKLEQLGIDKSTLKSIETEVDIVTVKLSEKGTFEQSSTELSMVISFVAAIIIYMFIFIYGSQVMRSVIEEKTTRIVEIIISSVKPFQLMMGKIAGVALVAITQFALWIILTLIITTVVQGFVITHEAMPQQNITQQMMPADSSTQISSISVTGNEELNTIIQSALNIPWFRIFFLFLFYFLGGYLLYTALFAAVGSAVDNETETQQFMFPITIPLVLGFILAQPVIQNPEGNLAFWLSIIPFTSPIIMMVRIPFGVPAWEMIISMVTLILTFVALTWLAAKIYRTGILMYGKKINYREIWKWIRYSD